MEATPQRKFVHRASDNILAAAKRVGWTGAQYQIALAMPHTGKSLNLSEYAETIRNIGLNVAAKRRRLSSLSAEELPCLFEDSNGTVGLLEKVDRDGAWIIWENAPAVTVDSRPRRKVVMLLVQKINTSTEKAELPIRKVIYEQRRSIAMVIATTCIINLIGLIYPFIVLSVYDRALPAEATNFLHALIIIAGLAFALDLALRGIRAWLFGAFGAQLERQLSQALFQKLIWLPLQNIQAASLFQQMQRVRQFDAIRDSMTGGFLLSAIDLPFALLFLGVIALFAPNVALVILGGLSFMAAIAWPVIKIQTRLAEYAGRGRTEHDLLVYQTSQNLTNVRMLNRRSEFSARFRTAGTTATQAQIKLRSFEIAVDTVGQAITALIGLAAIGLATVSSMNGQISFGALIVVITLVWRATGSVRSSLSHGQKFASLAATLRQANAVLKQESEMRRKDLQGRMKVLEAPLTMNSVFMRHSPVSAPALVNLSFRIDPGELVALTGPSGAGKSTLIGLLGKLYSPSTGAVTIGDIDYRQLAVEDIRQAVAIAGSDNWLFNASIRENFEVSCPGLTEEKIMTNLKRVGSHRDLRRLVDGIDTPIDAKMFKRMSAAQRRCFSLARALCRPGRLIVLDDAMSGLSKARADEVWAGLQSLPEEKTVIVVTHHLKHFESADRILCLKDGRLVLNDSGPAAAAKTIKILERY